MNRTQRAILLLLPAVLLLAFAAPPTARAAGDRTPLKLSARYDAAGKTAAVTVSATETIALSNYDIQLKWDQNAFTLTKASNEQKGFSSFFCNTNSAQNSYGKISAMSSGQNVTIEASQPLAVYTLSLKNAGSEPYGFTLEVQEAADANGDSLSWDGASCRCTLHSVTENAKSGSMGETIDWSFGETSGAVTITGPVSEARPILVASYDASGRMLSLRAIVLSGGVADIAKNAANVKVFWVDGADGVPLCENANFSGH